MMAAKTYWAVFSRFLVKETYLISKRRSRRRKTELDWLAADRLVYRNLETCNNPLGHPMEANVSLGNLGNVDPEVVVVPRAPLLHGPRKQPVKSKITDRFVLYL